MSAGYISDVMVPVTVLVAVSITEIELLKRFVTKTRVPSGVGLALYGYNPTGITALTVFVAVFRTDTLPPLEFKM